MSNDDIVNKLTEIFETVISDYVDKHGTDNIDWFSVKNQE